MIRTRLVMLALALAVVADLLYGTPGADGDDAPRLPRPTVPVSSEELVAAGLSTPVPS